MYHLLKPIPRYLREADHSHLAAALSGKEYPSLGFLKVKITTQCNLRCQKCNYWRRADRLSTDDMPGEMVKRIIAEATELGCRRVKLSGGEVLMRPDLPEFVRACSEAEMEVSITTNGTLLDESRLDALNTASLTHLTISLDSVDQDIHDRITGVAGANAATLRAISLVASTGIPRLTVAIVVSKENIDTICRTVRHLGEIGVQSVALISLVSWHLINDDLHVEREDEFHMLSQVTAIAKEMGFELDIRYPIADSIPGFLDPAEFYAKHICYVPWYHLYVNTDGTVSPCCYRKGTKIGSLTHHSLREIFFSAQAETHRNCKPSGAPACDICGKCTHEVRNNAWLGQVVGQHMIGKHDVG